MTLIKIKPLSVNGAFRGRKFKSIDYMEYENKLINNINGLLPNIKVYKAIPYKLSLIVGYSNTASDIDNCVKPFLDCLQKKYDFNDSCIYELNIKKHIVKKGFEFIEFNFEILNEDEIVKPLKEIKVKKIKINKI